ncbi:phosphoglucan phosphatase DSP4, chloroplastic-like, partial [Arachis ipaensis]|uniref:phosphoglucan phosphatase DSP4, chloroplastic-like n=1 Tax=Arachis ipaensis TaxID=130454 RepID=UPI000A2B3DF2
MLQIVWLKQLLLSRTFTRIGANHGRRCQWRGAWLSSSLPAPSPSSPLELREAVVAVVTIDASRCRLWVVASSASAVTLSSAPLDIAAFESCPVTRICCKKLSESGIDEKKHKPSTSNTAASKSKDGMEDYNFAMKRMMRNPYEYHHDLGLNYTLITDNLIVGSQPQKHEDIDHLRKEEGVTYILNLQQDKDVEYWGIDLNSITRRCHELDVRHMRRPAIDFDPNS